MSPIGLVSSGALLERKEQESRKLTNALQRTRPLLRFLLNPNSSGWGLAAEASR